MATDHSENANDPERRPDPDDPYHPGTRRRYSPPSIVEVGRVEELTQGGTGPNPPDSGIASTA